MYFSERQILMAIALAQCGIKESLILKVVTLDRKEELQTKPIEQYFERLEINKPANL